MTQGVSGWRRNDWDVADGGLLREPVLGPTPPPKDVSAEWLERSIPLFPQSLPVTALAANLDVPADERVRASLDSFLAAMNAPYRTPEGLAWPGTPFRMPQKDEKTALPQPDEGILASVLKRLGFIDGQSQEIRVGRGSPEAIHAVAQALIDEGRLPPETDGDASARVRIMMSRYRIGVDCAGYVQQAYLRLAHLDRAGAHFEPAGREDLSKLGTLGYARVPSIGSVRAGDIVVLGPPSTTEPGHRTIVYDQRLASDEEIDGLRAYGPEGRDLVAGGPVRILRVDSSWGASGNPLRGGVRRETCIYNESSGRWGWLEPYNVGDPPYLTTGPSPVNHPFVPPFGIYRGQGRRTP